MNQISLTIWKAISAYVIFQQQFSKSLIPAGYSRVHSYSDTNYPELASDSIDIRAQSCKTTFTSDNFHSSWVLHFSDLSKIQELPQPTPTLSFNNY